MTEARKGFFRSARRDQFPSPLPGVTAAPRRRLPFGVVGDDVRHLDDAVEVGAGRLNVASGGRSAHTTATFTQWIGGSASNRHSHFSPPSRPIHNWPVVVPMYSAGDFSSSTSSPSRSTVK